MMKRPVLIGGIWMFLGLIYSGQSFFYSLSVGREYVWQRSLFHSFFFSLEWALLTPLVLRLTERFPLDAGRLRRNLPLHFLIGITIALLQQSLYVVVTEFIDNGFAFSPRPFLPSIVGFFEYGVLMYWSIVFVRHAVSYYQRYQEEQQNADRLRMQLAEAQLQTLSMQLQPHFLFNTLNAISVLIRREPETAQAMIVRLSDCLRLTLERGNSVFITLAEETELLQAYLDIEKVRFGDRLTVEWQIDDASKKVLVPTFFLQPLAENAVRHGIARRSGNGWIRITARSTDGSLTVTMEDGGDGTGGAGSSTEGTGIGLENTRRRLEHSFGPSATLTLSPNEHHGMTVTIRIPEQHHGG